jgi:hypothetical protein
MSSSAIQEDSTHAATSWLALIVLDDFLCRTVIFEISNVSSNKMCHFWETPVFATRMVCKTTAIPRSFLWGKCPKLWNHSGGAMKALIQYAGAGNLPSGGSGPTQHILVRRTEMIKNQERNIGCMDREKTRTQPP